MTTPRLLLALTLIASSCAVAAAGILISDPEAYVTAADTDGNGAVDAYEHTEYLHRISPAWT